MKKCLIILILLNSLIGLGQDVHFSQYYSAPLFINPALTGNSSCNGRIGLNYRNQWSSITVPYVTQSAYIDGKIYPGFMEKDWLGIGGLFYNDKAGDGALKTTKCQFLASYHKSLNDDNSTFVSLGAGVGIINKSFDYTGLLFDSQWDGYSFNPMVSNNEPYNDNSLYYFNFDGGVQFSYVPSDKFSFWFGSSLSHINSPKESFYSNNNRRGMKTLVHAGMFAGIDEDVYIEPGYFYSVQKKARESLLGTNIVFVQKESKIYIGLWYRIERDLVPVFGFDYKETLLLISYDINISDMRTLTRYRGGLEISLRKSFGCSTRQRRNSGSVPMF